MPQMAPPSRLVGRPAVSQIQPARHDERRALFLEVLDPHLGFCRAQVASEELARAGAAGVGGEGGEGGCQSRGEGDAGVEACGVHDVRARVELVAFWGDIGGHEEPVGSAQEEGAVGDTEVEEGVGVVGGGEEGRVRCQCPV